MDVCPLRSVEQYMIQRDKEEVSKRGVRCLIVPDVYLGLILGYRADVPSSDNMAYSPVHSIRAATKWANYLTSHKSNGGAHS